MGNNKYKNDDNLDDIVFDSSDFENSTGNENLYQQEFKKYLSEKYKTKKKPVPNLSKFNLSVLSKELEKERRKKQEQIEREKRALEFAEKIKEEREELERLLAKQEREKLENTKKMAEENKKIQEKKKQDELEKQRLAELKKQKDLQEKERLRIAELEKQKIIQLEKQKQDEKQRWKNKIPEIVNICINYLLETIKKEKIKFISENDLNNIKKLITKKGYEIINSKDKESLMDYYAKKEKFKDYDKYKKKGLNNAIDNLLYIIGYNEILNISNKRENIKKQEKISENKKRLIAKLKERNKNIGFNVQNEIDKNVKISQNYLFIENQLKLKKYLEELYRNGLNSDNPIEFWKKYIYTRIHRKIKGDNKENILKKVFELARIEIMQEDLKNKNHKEYLEIRRKAGSRNNFIKLYGITGDIYGFKIDVKKIYGKIIEKVIEIYFDKTDYKYGLKEIFGTKEKAKEIMISLIYHESRGVFNSHNTGKKSSAFGLLQKLNANVKQFKINPFNPEESIKSFFDSIIIAFNNGISEEIIERSNIEERIQIALLVHYLGEGGTKKLLNNVGGDISNIKYSKYQSAKYFLKKTTGKGYYKA